MSRGGHRTNQHGGLLWRLHVLTSIKRTWSIILSSFYQQLKQKMKIQVKFHVHTKTLKPNVFLTFNIFSKKKTHLYHRFLIQDTQYIFITIKDSWRKPILTGPDLMQHKCTIVSLYFTNICNILSVTKRSLSAFSYKNIIMYMYY